MPVAASRVQDAVSPNALSQRKRVTVRVAPRLTACVFAALLVATSCSVEPAAPDPRAAVLRVVAGGESDTIFARPLQALIVEARDADGRIATGLTVRFTALFPNAQQPNPVIFLGQLPPPSFATSATDTTDSEGQAGVLLTMGPLAGDAMLQVSVPEIGITDTLVIAVLPGAPFRIRYSVRDSVLLLDSSYALTARVADRANNPRNEIPALINLTTTVCGLTGSQLKGTQMGRCMIEAQFGTIRDTARASVLPFARVTLNAGTALRLSTTNATAIRNILPITDGNISPRWAPDGSAIVFFEGNSLNGGRLSVVDTNGVRLTTIGANNQMITASLGRYSPDGQWIYFSGTDVFPNRMVIWRMKPDGSQRAAVTTAGNFPPLRVDASPDGVHIAFDVDNRIIVANLVTLEQTQTGVVGIAPSYSPDGQTIAFYGAGGNDLKLMNADGINVRTLVPGSFWEWQPPQWTADGTWIFTAFARFVNVADGTILPIPGLAQFSQVTLKPPLGRP